MHSRECDNFSEKLCVNKSIKRFKIEKKKKSIVNVGQRRKEVVLEINLLDNWWLGGTYVEVVVLELIKWRYEYAGLMYSFECLCIELQNLAVWILNKFQFEQACITRFIDSHLNRS